MSKVEREKESGTTVKWPVVTQSSSCNLYMRTFLFRLSASYDVATEHVLGRVNAIHGNTQS